MYRRIFLRSCAASGLVDLTTTRRVMARDEESRFPKPPPLPFRDLKSDRKVPRIRAVRLVPTQPLPKCELVMADRARPSW
jgi:hypothetical protein